MWIGEVAGPKVAGCPALQWPVPKVAGPKVTRPRHVIKGLVRGPNQLNDSPRSHDPQPGELKFTMLFETHAGVTSD